MLARRLTLLAGGLAATLATTLALVVPVASAADVVPAPTAPDPVTAALDPSPPGSNDWSCRPSAKHPEPVVLAHGLGANQANNWAYMTPILKREGYCVFSLTYGRNPLAPPPLSQVGGLIEMERSAEQFKAFVDRVRAATGAEKVDVFGHSEGSLMPNQYVRFLGGAEHVKRYIGLTPLWGGTTLAGLNQVDEVGQRFGLDPVYGPLLAQFCGSCRQFLRGSDFLQRMNSGGGPAAKGVEYTMILTRNDELVIPYTSGLLAGAKRNIVLQDVCPVDPSEHVAVAFDPNVAQLVLNALDPSRGQTVRCGAPA